MADLTLRALWNGQSVTQGIAKTRTEVGALGASVKSVVGALGIGFGIYQGWTQVQKVFHGVVEEATIFERLQNTINRRGGATADTMRAMNAEINRLASTGSALEDTAIANTLERLIETSGDTAGSIKNLNLAIDLSVAKHIDLERAAKIVGFVMKGEIDQATRLAPELKELARDFSDLKGTTELAAAGLKALATVTGAAEGERDTAAGNIQRLSRGVSELSENLFKMASGGTGFLDFLGKIGDHANRIAEAIERGSQHGGVIGGLLGGAAGSALEAYLRGTAPGIPRPGGPFRGTGMRQGISAVGDPSWWTRDQGPEWIPPGAPAPVTPWKNTPGAIPWQDVSENERIKRRFRGPSGGMRGDLLSSLPFGEMMGESSAYEQFTQKFQDDLRKDQELRDTISSVISDGILSGFQEGGFNGKRVLMSIIDDIAQMLLRKGISSIVGSIMTGGATGGGGGVGSFLGLLTGSSGSSRDVGRGPSLNARFRAQELRMARLG